MSYNLQSVNWFKFWRELTKLYVYTDNIPRPDFGQNSEGGGNYFREGGPRPPWGVSVFMNYDYCIRLIHFHPHYISQIFFRNIALKWYKNDGTKIIQKWYKNDHSFNFIEKLCYKCIPVKFSHWSIIWLFSIRGALPFKATLHTGARKLRKLSCKLSLANFHQLLSSFNQSLKQLYCISQFTNSA